jgi:hypothetical protein
MTAREDRMATTRDDLRRLIDDMPEGELDAVAALLRRQLAAGQPVGPAGLVMPERHDLEQLAREQGVSPVKFDDLKGDFWPEDEDPDEFINALRRWRSEDGDEGTA